MHFHNIGLKWVSDLGLNYELKLSQVGHLMHILIKRAYVVPSLLTSDLQKPAVNYTELSNPILRSPNNFFFFFLGGGGGEERAKRIDDCVTLKTVDNSKEESSVLKIMGIRYEIRTS